MPHEPSLTPAQQNWLDQSGLRKTRPRRCVACFLDHPEHPHLTVLQARHQMRLLGINLPPASLYNALNDFVRVGLARRFDLGDRTIYCLRQQPHHHFVQNGTLTDIPDPQPSLSFLPIPPLGKAISHVDIVLHLRDEAG